MKKAFSLSEIDAAVDKFAPIHPDHSFYVNFKGLRGDFQERELFRMLNIEKKEDEYYFNVKVNHSNKTFVFLAGMRGSGKTTELAQYAKLLDTPEAFFCITCNVDQELDMDNLQYMDIIIFQLEKLIAKADQYKVKIKDSVLDTMNKWFQDRVIEINRGLKTEGRAEIEIGNDDSFSLIKMLFNVTAKLKTSLSGSYERASKVRETLKNRFPDFAAKFNEFVEQVNIQIRKQKIIPNVLFIFYLLQPWIIGN